VKLARMKAEVLTAADREAAAIVTTARAEIRSIIVNARRELLGLATQIETLSNPRDDWPMRQALLLGLVETSQKEPTAGNLAPREDDSIRTAHRLLDSRHNLLDVLQEARPDLEHLRDGAHRVHLRAQPTAISEPQVDLDPHASPPGKDEPVLAAQPLIAEVSDDRPRTPAKVLAIVITLVVLAVLPGAVWWGLTKRAVFERNKPVLASSRSAPAPRAERAPAIATPPADVDPKIRPSAEQPGAQPDSLPRSERAASMVSDGPRGSKDHPASRVKSAEVSAAVGEAAPPAPASASLASTVADGRRAMGVPTPSTEAIAEAEAELTSAAERWLDAYYRRDSGRMAAMGAHDLEVSDQRATGEKPPSDLGDVRRALEQVKVQVVGDSTILTAMMIEQTDAADQSRRYLSRISQVWLREAGRWRLMQVRIISDARLK
jgi:hypothetical protein